MPLFIQVIGLERFGVLSICWLLLGYFGILDLGLTKAAIRQISSLRDDTPQARSEVFWTVFWLNAGLSIGAFLVAYPLIQFGLSLQNFPGQIGSEVLSAAPWLAASLGLTILVGPWGGAVMAREKFAFTNINDSIVSVAMSVVPLVVAWIFEPNITLLIISSLAVRVVGSLVYLVKAVACVPLAAPNAPRRNVAKKLLSYGGWSTVSSAIGPFLFNWDRLAIGSVLGAAAVSIYVVPFQLVWRLAIIPGALASALFPRLSSEGAAGALKMQYDAIANLRAIITPIILVSIAGAEPFLALWLGPKLGYQMADVAHILLVGLWINAIAQIGITVLLAQDRPKVVAQLHLSELIPYVVLLYFAMHAFGIEGAALLWTVRVAFDAAIMLRISTGNFAFLHWMVTPVALIGLLATVSLSLPLTSATRWIVAAAVVSSGFVWAATVSPDQLRDLFRKWTPQSLRKFIPSRTQKA